MHRHFYQPVKRYTLKPRIYISACKTSRLTFGLKQGLQWGPQQQEKVSMHLG